MIHVIHKNDEVSPAPFRLSIHLADGWNQIELNMHAVGPRFGTILVHTKHMTRTYVSGYCWDFWVFPKN